MSHCARGKWRTNNSILVSSSTTKIFMKHRFFFRQFSEFVRGNYCYNQICLFPRNILALYLDAKWALRYTSPLYHPILKKPSLSIKALKRNWKIVVFLNVQRVVTRSRSNTVSSYMSGVTLLVHICTESS